MQDKILIILKKKSTIYLLLLIFMTIILVGKGITKGDFWFPDAPRHAMNGVYIHDVMRDLPLANLWDYTIAYYARYPALSILIDYPPFFPIVESLFFSVFGISRFTARLTVLFFAVLAAIVWYKLIKLIYDEKIAFYSTVLFITTPLIVLWSREVMLEMPTLALIILSVYFFYNFFELNKKKHIYYCALATAFSILTKQTAVFILPLFLSYIFIMKKHRYLLKKEVIISCFILTILLLPQLIITLKYGTVVMSASIGSLGAYSRWSFSNWFHYISILPNLLTLPVLILSIISIVVILIKKKHKKVMLFFLWIFCYYIVFSYISNKATERYAYFWIPPFSLFAALMVMYLPRKVKGIPVFTILFMLLCVFQFAYGYNVPTRFIDGYEEAARYVVEHPRGSAILFDGYHDGDFIFHVRRYDTNRNMIVLRSSKILYLLLNQLSLEFTQYVQNEADVYKILNDYGVGYVIIEDKNIENTKTSQILRQALNSEKFTLVKKVKLDTQRTMKDTSLLIYQYNEDVRMKAEAIYMTIPGIGKDFVIPTKLLQKYKERGKP